MRAGRLFLLFGVLATLVSAEARAGDRYDGSWAIYVFGDPGPCGFGYRLPVRIQGLNIYYQGRTVSPQAIGLSTDGAVRIRLKGEAYVVTGSGSLHAVGGLGSGKWSAPSFHCKGGWRAERQ
jgi:hypothetical protein